MMHTQAHGRALPHAPCAPLYPQTISHDQRGYAYGPGVGPLQSQHAPYNRVQRTQHYPNVVYNQAGYACLLDVDPLSFPVINVHDWKILISLMLTSMLYPEPFRP